MKKILMWILVIVVALLVVAAGALVWLGIPSKGAAIAAKWTCSAVFVGGRPFTDQMLAAEVTPANPILKPVSASVDVEQRTVTGRYLGLFARTAAYTDARGCVLDLPADPSASPRGPAPADPAPWPQGNAPAPSSAWPAGVDAARLGEVVDKAFVGAGDTAAANARAIAIVQDGRLLVLRDAPGFAEGSPHLGWSMTKTLTGMLAYKVLTDNGIGVETRVVDAFPADREPPWVAAWRSDERAAITLADLLYMRDGLDMDEGYGPMGDVPNMLYLQPDMAAWAAGHESAEPAGQRWQYLSATTNILAAVVRAHFPTDEAYWSFPTTALFGPVGAGTGVMETDTAGTWVGSSYGWASAADWARFGQLMLDDGAWQGRRLIPAGWWELADTPAVAQGEGHGYGAQTWRLGDPIGGECRDNPGVPEDALAMEGHYGQLVAMVPSSNAVVVRLGWTFADDGFDGCQFLADVLATLPDAS